MRTPPFSKRSTNPILEAEQQCPNDGAQRVRIGEEVTEQLDVIPARVQVIRHIRPKYACRQCEDGVAIAPAPAQPLPKSNASANLLAYCLVAKYVDALPLYRQQQAFKRRPCETRLSGSSRCELLL